MKEIIARSTDVSTASFPLTLNVASDTEVYYLHGTKTLSGDLTIQSSDVPTKDVTLWIICNTAVTVGSNTFSIFGKTINPKVALTPFVALCFYTESAWTVFAHNVPMAPDGSTLEVDGTTGNLQLKNGGVTLAKLATDTVNALAAKATTTALSDAVDALTILINANASTTTLNAAVDALTLLINAKVSQSDYDTAIGNIGDAIALLTSKTYVDGLIAAINTNLSTNYSDNTAVTALVTAAVGTAKNLVPTEITSSVAFTAATIKRNIRINVTAGAVTATLPDASTLPLGFYVEFIQIGSAGAATIHAYGSQTLNINDGSDAASTTCGAAGAIVRVYCNGTNAWNIY